MSEEEYILIRWDNQAHKYIVTHEIGDPEPIGIRGYWFMTEEEAIRFANAQKLNVVVEN
jgi:hypothetical protein